MTGTQETDAFGRSIGGTGSTSSSYGYYGSEGYHNDADNPSSLNPYQKVGARYYDATFGRFITRDTDLSQAPYAYCDGDPVNFSDPTGHLSAVNIASGGIQVNEEADGGAAQAPVDTSGDNKSSSTTGYGAVGGDKPSGITGGVKTSGLTSTLNLTSAPVTVTLQNNNGHFASAGYSGSIPVFGHYSVTFGGSANVMPALNQSSVGVAYKSGGFMAGLSESSTGVTMLNLGYSH